MQTKERIIYRNFECDFNFSKFSFNFQRNCNLGFSVRIFQ